MSDHKDTYENSHALVVAIDDYHVMPPLENAVRGANALAELLDASFGFQVKTVFNDHVSANRILDWFTSLQCGANDRVIFYFAGHGLTRVVDDRTVGYLAMPDARTGEYQRALKMDYLIQEAEILAAKHVLLIIDACFSGLVLKRSRGDRTDEEIETDKLVRRLISRPVRYAITAGGVESVDDNASPSGTLSLFTHFLLEGLQGGAQEIGGLIRARSLGNYLEKKVAGSSLAFHKPNHGYLNHIGDGDFVFQLPTYLRADVASDQCIVLDPANLLDPHVSAILRHFSRVQRLAILEQITEGQSGSHMFLVEAASGRRGGPDGALYCKVYRTPTGEEKETHESAFKTLPRFVPRLVDNTPLLDGWMACLYEPAHKTTLGKSQSLSNLLRSNMFAAVRGVSSLIEALRQWNSDPLHHSSTPQELLNLPLLRYLKGSSALRAGLGERIESLIEGLTAKVVTVQYYDQVLPNPLAFLSNPLLWGQSRPILWPYGHSHGDLHSNNVIFLIDARTKDIVGDPVIIDFDTYSRESSLFFDLSFLEIDIAIRMLPPERPEHRKLWLAVSKYLVQGVALTQVPPLPPECFPLNALLVPIRHAADIISKKHLGDYEAAYWLARTSAGLGFARKRKVNGWERKLALLLAAQSLGRALDELEIGYADYQQPLWIDWLERTQLESDR